MSESEKTYSRRQLISVAEVANAFALSRDIAGLEAVQQLAECVLQGKLCADLYPPHQYWQHGGQSDLIGKPAQNSVQVWRSLAAKSVERHMSDKDDFNYPPSASTYHLLADDVFAFARTGGLSARAAEAMHDLSVRHKAELATPKSSEPQTKFAPSHQAAASVVAESASNAPAWTVRKPKRYRGYAAPLHRLLVAAQRDGNLCPTARDVVEAWRNNAPAEIAKVLPDGFDYYDANGNTKTAGIDAIRNAIKRMTSAR